MISPPVSIGFSFPIPPKYIAQQTLNMGGYSIVAHETEGIIICGFTEVNISLSPIAPVTLFMLDTERIINEVMPDIPEVDRATSPYWTFEYEPNSIYFFVVFIDHTWVFNDLNDAMNFVNFIINYKKEALVHRIHDRQLLNKEDTCPSVPIA